MASQVQIPFEGVILQEHSAPISCPTPNFAKGSLACISQCAVERRLLLMECETRPTTVAPVGSSQDVPLDDVQYLAGHANPRTTQIYDRGGTRISHRGPLARLSFLSIVTSGQLSTSASATYQAS